MADSVDLDLGNDGFANDLHKFHEMACGLLDFYAEYV